MPLAVLLVSLFTVLLPAPLLALGWDPAFDADRAVGASNLIVIGKLFPDGRLEDLKAIDGKLVENAGYAIANGVNEFERFGDIVGKGPFHEVIAFLCDVSNPADSRAAVGSDGLVVFTPSGGVCGKFSSSGGRPEVHASQTRGEFLALVDRALADRSKLDLILGQEKSRERMETLLQFMRDHIDWSKMGPGDPYFWQWEQGFVFNKCLKGAVHPSAEEEIVIQEELRNATSDERIAMILAFITFSNCSEFLFEDALPYVERSRSSIVRREAFRALVATESRSGSAILAGHLRLDDPDLQEMVEALLHNSIFEFLKREETKTFNHAVVAHLMRFSDEVQASPGIGDGNLARWTIPLLKRYRHPVLIPTLIRWTKVSSDETRNEAIAALRHSLLEKPDAPFSNRQLEQWWNQSAATFSRAFDLQSEEGCKQWLLAWKDARNPVEKKLLLRLWHFEPTIPEKMLLEACGKEDWPRVKLLLSKLWKKELLSAEARESLVVRYLDMSLVEEQVTGISDDRRDVHVSIRPAFPFPTMENHYLTGEVRVGWEAVLPSRDRAVTFEMAKIGQYGPRQLSARGYGAATAVVEIFEQKRGTSPSSDIWRVRWELGNTASPTSSVKGTPLHNIPQPHP